MKMAEQSDVTACLVSSVHSDSSASTAQTLSDA